MKKSSKIALSVVALGMISSGIIASVAWFTPGANSFSAGITGKFVEEYFHCGSGKENDPFVITRPIHYYHLTEFFQRETVLPTSSGDAHFGTDYLYFQVGYPLKSGDSSLYVYDYDNTGTYTGTADEPAYSKTLNLSYFSGENALMPIGTNEIPFFGSFNGGASTDASQGITIDNLNIKTSDTVLIGNQNVNRTTSDAGVFGYVADQKDDDHKTSIHNAYFNNLTIDLSGASASGTSSPAHIDSHADNNIYVGYIVGHLHTYTSYNATGPVNSSPLYDVYVNNAKIEGGAGAQSNFGYVGYADTIDGVSGDEIVFSDIIDELTTAAGGGGQGDDWGGSIAFDAFNNRLYNQLNTTGSQSIRYKNGSTTYSKGLIKARTNDYSSVAVHRGGTSSAAETYLAQDPASNYVVYNLIGAGTHKINAVTSGTGTTYTASSAVAGTYEPILINSDYSTATKNTGYLTSSQYAYGTGHYTGVDGTVRSASYPNGQIANSIDDTYHDQSSLYNSTTGGPKFTFNGSKLEILTNSSASYSSSNYRLISDDYNSAHTVTNSALSGYTKVNYSTLGLTRYKDARSHLETVLTNSQYVHGIHFMGEAPVANKTVNVPNAIINGVSKSNYPVLLSAVDFNVKEEGYITLFAGAYYPATKDTLADCFFDLFKVNRNGDSISSIQKIYKVYKDSSGNYTYTTSASQTVSGATLMFDMSYLMNQPPKNNVAYYFEIPVDAGEYAIGAVSGKTAGAYLMYLDIAASGSEEQHDYNTDNMISNDPIFTQMEYCSTGFVINSCFNIAYVVPTGADKETFWIKVSRTDTVFAVEVCNTTSNAFNIDILLVDNNSNHDDTYPYTYTLRYNGGQVSSPYNYSASFTGAASGTAFVIRS